MSLASHRTDGIEVWTGRLLATAGAVLLLEAATGSYGTGLQGLPVSWMLTGLPFGIGLVLIPFVLFRSYQYLGDPIPTSARVGVALVAAPPVFATIIVSWSVLALAGVPTPDATALPVKFSTIFYTLMAMFGIGVAIFGLTFLRDGRNRFLGGSLLAFALAWGVPLGVAKLSGVYPAWLANLLVISVAASMIAIGYCFPPGEREASASVE